jgi:hypothetical protein
MLEQWRIITNMVIFRSRFYFSSDSGHFPSRQKY